MLSWLLPPVDLKCTYDSLYSNSRLGINVQSDSEDDKNNELEEKEGFQQVTMILGFGNCNQVLVNHDATCNLRATQAQEEAIQCEIFKCDALLDSNNSELETLRKKWLTKMKQSTK